MIMSQIYNYVTDLTLHSKMLLHALFNCNRISIKEN